MRWPAAALAALALAAACGPGRFVRRGTVNEDAMALVRARLPVVRELAFVRPVPVVAEEPDAVKAMVSHEIDDSYRPGDLERLEATYTRLGLIPEGTSLRAAIQQLFEEEGAGFYDPRTKRLVLATRALKLGGPWMDVLTFVTGNDLAGGFIVGHELTHALQDQHYGIPSDPEPLTDSHGDALLARRALLEGDATLAGFAYVLGDLDASTVRRLETQFAKVPAELAAKYPTVPTAVRATLAFQYADGTAFAGWAFTAGGWPAVDRAHADPPESTEQVLHPARYFGVRDRPVTVTVGGTDEVEAAGWSRIVEDTMGELQVRLLAERFLPAPTALLVADGWGGDRLRAFARGGDTLIVWLSAWDSPADAEEFATAMPAIRPGAIVQRRDDRVLVALGPPTGVDLARLAAHTWKASRFVRS